MAWATGALPHIRRVPEQPQGRGIGGIGQGGSAVLQGQAQIIHLQPGHPERQPKLPGNYRLTRARYAADQQHRPTALS
jgi:hypothetical protein